MTRILSDEDIDAIAQRLTDFSGLTAEEHKKHHEAFTLWIERQSRRTAFWQKVQEQVGGWAIISFLGAVGFIAWNGFIWILQKGH